MDTREEKYPLTLSDLISFIDQGFRRWSPRWKEAEANERRWIAKNYTPQQEQEIRDQERQPYSMAQARIKLSRIIGAQQSQQTEFNITASQDQNDEPKAELAKLQVHAVERRSEFIDLENEVFTSGLAILIGVSKMSLDHTDVYQRVQVEKVDYKNFMFDPNSVQYDINKDALWVCEIEKVYRKLLDKEYGVSPIDNLREGNTTVFQGREKQSYYIRRNTDGNNNYDIISKFNFYIKQPKKLYYVIFPDSESLVGTSNMVESKHETRAAAEARLRELQIPYLLQGLELEGSVESKDSVGLDKYVFTYDRILEYESTDLEMFPYNVFFGIKLEDEFISYMDVLKDPQKWYDRFIMQIDYAMGRDNKIASTLNVTKLAENETPDTALAKIQNGETILVSSSDDVLRYVDSKGANPQWMGMIDLLTAVMEDLGGGAPFQSKAMSGDSGRKVDSLIAQGSLIAKPFVDNLRRWKRLVGRNILWWLQHYETAQDVIRVQGGTLTPEMIELLQQGGIYKPSKFDKDSGYLTINQEGNELSYLKDSSFELEVSEQAMSDNEKNSQFIIATTQEKTNPLFMQSLEWQKYKLSLMPIPQSIRFKMIQELEALQKQSQQGNEPMPKPPSESISFKDLPPEGKVQMAAHAGIQLDPQEMAISSLTGATPEAAQM